MTACRISSTSSISRLLLVVALLATGCVAERATVILPPPGASVALSTDGVLRMRDLDELAPQCAEVVASIGSARSRLVLLVPGGDADAAAESLTFAQCLRESGYTVRRTHRRKLEPGETLVEVFPITDGAIQLDDGAARAWRIELEVRVFSESEQPALATRRLIAQWRAPIARP